jgi:hypothetical protein
VHADNPSEGSSSAEERFTPASSDRVAPVEEGSRDEHGADASMSQSSKVQGELKASSASLADVPQNAARNSTRKSAGDRRAAGLPAQTAAHAELRHSAVEMASARLSETPLYVLKDEDYRQVCHAVPCNRDLRAATSAGSCGGGVRELLV